MKKIVSIVLALTMIMTPVLSCNADGKVQIVQQATVSEGSESIFYSCGRKALSFGKALWFLAKTGLIVFAAVTVVEKISPNGEILKSMGTFAGNRFPRLRNGIACNTANLDVVRDAVGDIVNFFSKGFKLVGSNVNAFLDGFLKNGVCVA